MYIGMHKRSHNGWRSLLGALLVVLTALLPAVIQRSSCMMAPKAMSCCHVAMTVSTHTAGSEAIHSTCDC